MPAGRPSKLTPERRDLFVTVIREGNYVDVAATVAGISKSSVYSWLAKGREAKSGEYLEFLNAVKEAEAFAERTAVGQVRRAATQDPKAWAAAMTFLERRFRDRWSRPPSVMQAGAPEPGATASVTDEPVVVPVADRVSGILATLNAAGKLGGEDGHGPEGSGPPGQSVQGNGRGTNGRGAG